MLHEVRPVADILNDLWKGRQRIAALNELGADPCRKGPARAHLQGGMGRACPRRAGRRGAACGVGCISTADAGYREPDFARDPASANHRALTAEIQSQTLAKGAGLVSMRWWPPGLCRAIHPR